jgi:hypothetical protein
MAIPAVLQLAQAEQFPPAQLEQPPCVPATGRPELCAKKTDRVREL